MLSRKPSTMRPASNAIASAGAVDPRTPVAFARTKQFEPTEGECNTMNALLHRMQTENMDLQSQLDALNKLDSSTEIAKTRIDCRTSSS